MGGKARRSSRTRFERANAAPSRCEDEEEARGGLSVEGLGEAIVVVAQEEVAMRTGSLRLLTTNRDVVQRLISNSYSLYFKFGLNFSLSQIPCSLAGHCRFTHITGRCERHKRKSTWSCQLERVAPAYLPLAIQMN